MRIPIVSPLMDAIFGKGQQQMQDNEMYTPAQVPPLDLSGFCAPEFQEAHYRQVELDTKLDSKDAMLEFIRDSHLSLRCKNAFIQIVNTYYDRNILLSDLTGKKVSAGSSSDEQVLIAYWRAKIDVMGTVRCSASRRKDRMRPEFTTIEQLILSQIWYRLKRTKGKDRWAMIKGRMQISYNTAQAMQVQKTKEG